MGKTAAELMAELANDEEYQKLQEEQDRKFNELEEMYRRDEAGLLEDLKAIGIRVGSVWDFVNRKNDYLDAVPVLIKHLEKEHHPKTISGLARALAIPKLSSNYELWGIAVELYKKTPSNDAIDEPIERGSQESLAILIEAISSKKHLEDLQELVIEFPNADGIEWLIARLKELSG